MVEWACCDVNMLELVDVMMLTSSVDCSSECRVSNIIDGRDWDCGCCEVNMSVADDVMMLTSAISLSDEQSLSSSALSC